MKAKTFARERALRFLYQEGQGLGEDTEIIEDLEISQSRFDLEFFQKLISETHSKKDELKAEINKHSTKYKFNNQNIIDMNILFIALVEINYFDEVPNIVINEAIELAKKYSTPEGKNFIHAFLDNYVGGK